jgi:YD repeat-containing protein
LDVKFNRAYNSGSNYNLGALGYGWSHNHQVFLAHSSDYAPGLGQRQPTDAAALIVFTRVILDVMGSEDNIQGWMTADLTTKWGMDQLLDNAVTVHLIGTSLEYIRLPDGNYNPPPGIRQALIQEGNYYYVQGSGNTCMIFDADGRGRVWLDANGNTLTYTYDGEGKLLSVGAPTLGQTLTLVYSGTLLTSVSDQAGRTVAFEYTDDELTTFRDAEGHATHYSYDAAHRLASVTRPRGNTVVTNV